MARTYPVKNISVPSSILEALEAKKQQEGRLGSLTAYASEILSRYINGSLVSEELLRAQIAAEPTLFSETPRPTIKVKAHQPTKEDSGFKRKAG